MADATEEDQPNATPVLKLVRSDGEIVDEPDEIAGPSNDPLPAVPGLQQGSHATASGAAAFPQSDRLRKLRIIEAVLFASPEAVSQTRLSERLDDGDDVVSLLEELQRAYAERGVNLVKVAGKWAFRTASDLSFVLERYAVEERRLSKAGLETLAIIAYHQPVTRAEIEEIRGVSTSSGTLDILLETGWVRMRGRRRAPGRPVTYGTTDAFLEQFSLENIGDLPGLSELKGAGLLDSALPANFRMPQPTDVAALMPDEMPLEDDEGEDEVDAPDELDLEGDEVDAITGHDAEDLPDAAQPDTSGIPD